MCFLFGSFSSKSIPWFITLPKQVSGLGTRKRNLCLLKNFTGLRGSPDEVELVTGATIHTKIGLWGTLMNKTSKVQDPCKPSVILFFSTTLVMHIKNKKGAHGKIIPNICHFL